MFKNPHAPILRREDGSIDVDSYARHSAALRREAIADMAGRLANRLRGLLIVMSGRLVERGLIRSD